MAKDTQRSGAGPDAGLQAGPLRSLVALIPRLKTPLQVAAFFVLVAGAVVAVHYRANLLHVGLVAGPVALLLLVFAQIPWKAMLARTAPAVQAAIALMVVATACLAMLGFVWGALEAVRSAKAAPVDSPAAAPAPTTTAPAPASAATDPRSVAAAPSSSDRAAGRPDAAAPDKSPPVGTPARPAESSPSKPVTDGAKGTKPAGPKPAESPPPQPVKPEPEVFKLAASWEVVEHKPYGVHFGVFPFQFAAPTRLAFLVGNVIEVTADGKKLAAQNTGPSSDRTWTNKFPAGALYSLDLAQGASFSVEAGSRIITYRLVRLPRFKTHGEGPNKRTEADAGAELQVIKVESK